MTQRNPNDQFGFILFRMEDHVDSNLSDIEELFLDIVPYKKTKETILS